MPDDSISIPLIIQLLQRPIAFHRIFRDITGSAISGIFLSQAWYWQQRSSFQDGWWWKTQIEWREETGLSDEEQLTARRRLVRLGILKEERRGIPAKMYFKLNLEAVESRIRSHRELDSGLTGNWIPVSPGTIPEITSEITSETKKDSELTSFVHPGEVLCTNPQGAVGGVGIAHALTKKAKKSVKPLDADDWLLAALHQYEDDIDVEALNDDQWWARLANSFPVFERSWVERAFADLAEWLTRNTARTPRTPRGWKARMKYSLNYFYDKDQRRQSYGNTTSR